jgi:hypothetical protein
VRPAGGRGGPERRQHERGVVHHRDLRDIHRREGSCTARAGGSLPRWCPVQRPAARAAALPLLLLLSLFLRTAGTPCERRACPCRGADETAERGRPTGHTRGDEKRRAAGGKARAATAAGAQ